MERREHRRVPVCYLSTFSTDEKKTVSNAVVLDLSLGGCRVHSFALVDPGTQVDLQIALPNYPAPFVVKQARVRWAREREFGVSFIRLHPEDQKPLRRLMSLVRARERIFSAGV
ncbi:MAG TPA: PilZ domain-containing protein [Nitrospiraceae bacterium]|nr:PilZ domain-containing protein [Nitrospiraceae bacterium]